MAKKKPKDHYQLAHLARAKAGAYGVEAESVEEAIKTLGPERAAECALLELVRRLNQAIGAWAKDKDPEGPEFDDDKPPEYATPFPSVEVGDTLYCCSTLDDGVTRMVVASRDAEGYIRTVVVGDHIWADPKGRVHLHWGDAGDRPTAAEAVRAEAESDVRYHGARLRRAEAILKAVRMGEPFDHLLGEVEGEGEEAEGA